MANRITQFFERLAGNKAPTSLGTPERPLVAFGDMVPFDLGFSFPQYDTTKQLELYTGWVYDCVTKIAQEFAAINLKLYKMDKNGDVTVQDRHAVLDLLDRVNPFMTFYDLKELTNTYQELTGNAYWWLMRNKQGQVIEIYPWLRPDRMTVIPDTKTFIKGYKYNAPGGEEVFFEPSEIIHFKYTNPQDPYHGSSPVAAANIAINTDLLASKFNQRFFTNSARPDGILQFKDGIDEKNSKRILEAWNQRHSQGNEHRIGLLSKGEYKPISMSQKDMDFVQQRSMSRDEILAAWKVPKSLLGITEDVNYATAEAARKSFLKQVIVPKVEKFVQYLNEFLLPQFADGDNYFFDFDNPVPEEQSMRVELYTAALGGGGGIPWMSPNEVRALEGLPPFTGGDNIYVPFNLVPSGSTDQENKGFLLGTTDHKKLAKKFNVRIPSRTQQAKRLEVIKEAVIESGMAVKLVKPQDMAEKDAAKKDSIILSKEFLQGEDMQGVWQKVWQQKINKTDNEERLMIMLMRREFNRQRDQVLKSVQSKALVAKGISYDFNVDKEKDIFVSIFSPVLNQIVAEHGKDALGLLGRSRFDTGGVSQQYVKDQGLKFAKEVNKVTSEAINDQISQGIAAGDSIPQIKDRISSVFKEASDARANTIARTEVSRASNFGTKEGYRQSGVVKYTEWFTAGDEAVCPYCSPMQGKKAYLDSNYFDKGDSLLGLENKSLEFGYDNIGDPPLHVQCRCVLIPHTDDAEFFDKEKSEEAFDLKDFEGSDAETNRNASEAVNQLFAKHGTELADYGNRFNWKTQYTDINQLEFGIAGDEARISQYVAAMQKGDKFPAITAQIVGNGKPTVLDGAHRLEALKRLGARIIPVVVGRVAKPKP